jgi:hypothetical protein
MNLSKLPRDVLERYIQDRLDDGDRSFRLFLHDYNKDRLVLEREKLEEEVSKCEGDVNKTLQIRLCINEVEADLAKLGRTYDALIK